MKLKDYEVRKQVGETEHFRLYEIALPEGGVGILKITASTADNPLLDWEAFILQTMKDEAINLEYEFTKVSDDPKHTLGYQITFPNLVESFIAADQGKRRANILTFVTVPDDLSRLVPVAHIVERDCVRVDAMTSAWMVGKTLKLIAFAHNQGIAIGSVAEDNILIERDQHYVMIFDWTRSTLHETGIPDDAAREDISHAAQAMVLALEGDPATGALPDDGQLPDDRYANFLHNLACANEGDANKAHTDFYALVRSLWPRKYYPYTSHPRKGGR